jgi:membrane-associated phospholipid phosphatase
LKGKQAIQQALSPSRARRRKTIILLVCLAALTGLFVLLALFVRGSAYTPIDLKITRFIQALDTPAGTGVMVALSWPGYAPQSIIAALAAILLLYRLGLHWESAALVFSLVFEEILNFCIKIAIHRPRPAASLVHVFISLKSYSFPSGHVMFYTCFFGFLWYLAFMLLHPSRLRALLLSALGIMIAAIGLSRIWLGEHWATDVLGAYIAGFATLICSIQFYRMGKIRNWIPHR